MLLKRQIILRFPQIKYVINARRILENLKDARSLLFSVKAENAVEDRF